MNTLKVLRVLMAVVLIVMSFFTWHVISEYKEEYTEVCSSTCSEGEDVFVDIGWSDADCRCVVEPGGFVVPGGG